VYVAPEVFSQDDDDGIVILLTEQPAASLGEAVAEAARQCPSMAIRIEET
jgi:ferredoxin